MAGERAAHLRVGSDETSLGGKTEKRQQKCGCRMLYELNKMQKEKKLACYGVQREGYRVMREMGKDLAKSGIQQFGQFFQ